jgi:hypothetical protein
MHLRPYPQAYVKGDERRLVYYTVEARELRENGWVRESGDEPEAPATVEAAEEKAEFEPEPVVGDPDFEAMTKRELLQYAADNGIDLPDNALKAELIEACKAI